MKPKVLITRLIPKNGIDMLKDEFELIINTQNRNMSYDEILKASKDVFGIISMVSDKIDSTIIKKAQKLKIIANYGVGINNVDIDTATQNGVLFTNTPDVLTNATAELAFGLIMALARRIPKADKFLRSGSFSGFDPVLFLGEELYGSTMGIIGMGRIGSTVARIARFGFNMRVLYYNRTKSPNERLIDAERVELDELLKNSDVVVVTAPLNDDSRHMISKKEFALMKDDAIFVNVGRGEVVDTDALIEKAKTAPLFKVGLDVYENEPNFDERLLELKNCILLPHIGSATRKTRMKMAEIVATNMIRVKNGQCPLYAVNGGQLCRAND
ncbi:2-hydroxyacid dehydrogenase [Hippea jasoniae]|uniref:2-hydroxyacid dehydrogenase n=1 Tax=Hippea jasoniae TaxID=944479 RepID=UPI0005551C07|nr:D-glycerate dehydrogenase [Hippea jasoniae]